MDAYDEAMFPTFHHPALFTQVHNEVWDEQQPFRQQYIDQTPVPTMERFLQETEHSFCFPRYIYNNEIEHGCLSPEAGPGNHYLPATSQHFYPPLKRCASPSDSSPTSSQDSSGYCGGYSTPLSSPTPSIDCRSPEIIGSQVLFQHGGQFGGSLDRCDTSDSCVSMHDVQGYPDAQPEIETFEDEHVAYYAPYPIHEGYQPMQSNDDPVDDEIDILPEDESITVNGGTHREEPPNFRHRRPQATRSVTSARSNGRVSKRSSTKKQPKSQSKSMNDKDNGRNHAVSNRAFPCPFTIYGCTSTFGSKNEWKRHINTQHMRMGYWRCDLCDQAERKPNDFNRKDLFIQHIRRMHPMETKKPVKTKSNNTRSTRSSPEEQALVAAAHRCWRQTRSPPEESGCLFCDVKFNGSGTWDERLEHIGRHMESAKKGRDEAVQPNQWQTDEAMEDWLVQEKIIVESDDGYALRLE